MQRIAPISDEQVTGPAKEMFASIEEKFGMVPNIFRTMAYAPEVLEATLKMYGAIEQLPAKFVELAYLKTAMINSCAYCSHHHKQAAKKAGVSDEQLAAMDSYADSDLFDEQEKTVLSFADQLTSKVEVDTATTDKLKEFLDQKQLVTLAATVGLANWTNRFNDAFDIELP